MVAQANFLRTAETQPRPMSPFTGTPNGKRDVRILLVGEDGVGKTSLILTLITEEFPDFIPAKAEEITIPADVTPEKVPTHIVDFSAQLQSEEELHAELKKANAICVVYAVDDQNSMDKITSYWMPTIQTVLGPDHGKPVLLVGNKSDQVNDSTMDQMLPIMSQYAEIETCVECSAKQMKNISELFYYAQKAVLHPSGPLYVPEDKELTPACKKAFVRIFKICDRDNDGLLNDDELNDFQVRCFGAPLNPIALQDIKAVVKRSISEGILEDKLTLKGFLYLHTLFIQRGRHETAWTVLRRFGYDNSLQLSKEYLFPPLKIGLGCSTELSVDGLAFLVGLFHKYDEDKDDCLSPPEIQNLFSVCPTQPWGVEVANTVLTNDQGWISFDGYLAYWVLTTLLEVPRTLEYLAYLGYVTNHRDQLSALTITRDKRIDWETKSTSRSVFQCHVIGPKNVGKTAFLQAFIHRNLQVTVSVCTNKLHEIDVVTTEDRLSDYELSADVICLMYDVSDPNSFEYCFRIFKKYFHRSRVPCLVVGTKADRRDLLQFCEFQPADFCRKFRLPPPLMFSAQEPPLSARHIYEKIGTLAMFPHLKHKYHLATESSTYVKVGIGVAVLAMFGFIVAKNL